MFKAVELRFCTVILFRFLPSAPKQRANELINQSADWLTG